MNERFLGADAVERLLNDPNRGSVPQPGDLVSGKYRVTRTLGTGGVAQVLEAHHVLLDKPVALKLLMADESEAVVERFLVEARAASKVESPHVVRIMDVATLDDGVPFIVMERLEGCNLDELLFLEHTPAVADVIDYMLQALQGLAHAHLLGVVHRDLKPANLFLARQVDGSTVVKILDFGIALVLDEAGRPPESEIEAAKRSFYGSPVYMSPEQVRGDATIDGRTDLWSLGVVLYEMLTARAPFGSTATSLGDLFAAILNEPLTPPSSLREELPKALDAVLAQALERTLESRYGDPSQFARALVPFGSGKWSHLAESMAQAYQQRHGA